MHEYRSKRVRTGNIVFDDDKTQQTSAPDEQASNHRHIDTEQAIRAQTIRVMIPRVSQRDERAPPAGDQRERDIVPAKRLGSRKRDQSATRQNKTSEHHREHHTHRDNNGKCQGTCKQMTSRHLRPATWCQSLVLEGVLQRHDCQ